MNKKIIGSSAILVIFLAVVFIANQTVEVFANLKEISIELAYIILSILLLIYLVLIYLIFNILIRFKPRSTKSSLDDIQRLIANNKLLKQQSSLSTDESIAYLDSCAIDKIKKYAGQTFLATAVSQSGKLDGLFVLVSHIRMIKEIAEVYDQRPTFYDLGKLYANVAGTVFLSVQIEDAELEEYIEPIIGNILSSSFTSVIPGVNVAGTFLINSLLDGTINAYLTLRVGLIAKEYSNFSPTNSKEKIRKYAIAEAGKLLGEIVISSGKKVVSIVYEKSKEKAKNGFLGIKEKIKNKAGDFFSNL